MLLYEMFAIVIAVVLLVAAIDGLAARVMGPEETALLRLARAAPAQRRLVASAAQQERDARAAAASAASWPQQPGRMTGFDAASSANTKMHSRRRSHRVSLHSSLNSKHKT
jgi:hypothetical protein